MTTSVSSTGWCGTNFKPNKSRGKLTCRVVGLFPVVRKIRYVIEPRNCVSTAIRLSSGSMYRLPSTISCRCPSAARVASIISR